MLVATAITTETLMLHHKPEPHIEASKVAGPITPGRPQNDSIRLTVPSNSGSGDEPTSLGVGLYKRGNYAGAMPLLREAIQKAPDSAEFHYHLGMTLVASGQKAMGKKELEAALHLKLDSANEQQARQALAQLN
jgi:Flp pilus assembly protein TadD